MRRRSFLIGFGVLSSFGSLLMRHEEKALRTVLVYRNKRFEKDRMKNIRRGDGFVVFERGEMVKSKKAGTVAWIATADATWNEEAKSWSVACCNAMLDDEGNWSEVPMAA
jgi:hypothetical protein